MDGKGKRMVVTGREGPIVRSLLERWALNDRFEVLALGRSEFDLRDPDGITTAFRQAQPDFIVSAAHTGVDGAETEEAEAHAVNAVVPSRIPEMSTSLDIAGGIPASWADFVTGVFAVSAQHGGRAAAVGRIPSSTYPTPARQFAARLRQAGTGAWRAARRLETCMAETVDRLFKERPAVKSLG